MIGSTPPASSLSGDAPITMADKMRDFLKANPKVMTPIVAFTRLRQNTVTLFCGSPGIASSAIIIRAVLMLK